jgi:hypothetical protein
MNNLESIWQRLTSRNQDDMGAQRRYWLDLLKGRTNLGPPAPGASPAQAGGIPPATGSGPAQPLGALSGGIPAATGSGPYQPQGSVGIPLYSGSGPYQPLNLPKPNIPLYSGSGPSQPMGTGQQRSNILDVLRNTFGRR